MPIIFNREIAEFYGYRPGVRPYATSSNSGKADYVRPQTESQEEKLEEMEEEDRISGITVRLANEKLTYSGIYSYSGISQTNAPLETTLFYLSEETSECRDPKLI